ncbi:MAG: hypothetical protein ABEK36_02895 [Candidatus Aenigmatarchaeota archaeon]
MKKEILIITLLTSFSLLSVYTLAAQADVTVWVEAALGVSIEGKNETICYRGEECGVWLTINNDANIRDKLKLTAGVYPETEGHIFYDFECAETIGECGNKTVENMILTPSINQTQVYLTITPMASENVISQNARIEIFGWSQTNNTYNDLHNVSINMQTKNYIWDPLEAPGLKMISIIILFIASPLIFSKLVTRNNQ